MRTARWLGLCLLGGVAAGCARRAPYRRPAPAAVVSETRAARAERLMAEAKSREPHVPMLPEEDARKAVPSMERYPQVPNLIRILAAMPKTTDAEMEAWDALRRESTVDRRLLNEVFWVVSSGNECGH
jgi:hypothetical protein